MCTGTAEKLKQKSEFSPTHLISFLLHTIWTHKYASQHNLEHCAPLQIIRKSLGCTCASKLETPGKNKNTVIVINSLLDPLLAPLWVLYAIFNLIYTNLYTVLHTILYAICKSICMHLHAHACMCRCMYMCIMYVIDTSQVLINSSPFSIKYCIAKIHLSFVAENRHSSPPSETELNRCFVSWHGTTTSLN